MFYHRATGLAHVTAFQFLLFHMSQHSPLLFNLVYVGTFTPYNKEPSLILGENDSCHSFCMGGRVCKVTQVKNTSIKCAHLFLFSKQLDGL